MKINLLNTNKKLMDYKKSISCVLGGVLIVLSSQDYLQAREKSFYSAVSHTINWESYNGKVTDDKGEPLVGVTVAVKGSKSGTVTDINGNFTINVPVGSTLVISYLGFETKEVTVKENRTINITLEESLSSLKEVVVTAYGTQKKDNLTNSVVSVDIKRIEDLPVGSLSATLRGQVPGVSVSGGQSRPGNAALITVRNPSIFSKDGGTLEPLYVVDDVIKTSDEFNQLDLSEIESITVLKDAAAAIYGVNGNQGAIVVKTKRGEVGAPRISYSGSVGFTDAVKLPEMMNGYQLATYLNDYNIARGQGTSSSIYTQDELDYFKDHNYDWLDMAWKTSMVNRQTVNASGGTDKATYFGSISYNSQDGNLDKINSNRWTYRASTDIKLTQGLKLGLQVSGGLSNSKMYYLKQGGESAEKDILSLLQTPQYDPPYINGLPVLITTATNSTTENFHFFEIQGSNNYTQTKGTDLNLNLNLEYAVPFVKGLTLKGIYNRHNNNDFGKQYGTVYNVYQFSMLGTNKHIYGGDIQKTITLKNGDIIRFNPTASNNYQLNGSVNYNRTFGKHTISALALVEQRESYTDGVATYIENPIVGGTDNVNYATGTSVLQSEGESEAGYLSYVGRLNYDFANKYLAEFTFRADASSGFAPENRWGYFPSVSLGWVVSEENFFKEKLHFADFFKIRGGVGFAGADRTRPFQWYDKYKKETGKGAVFGGDADRTLTVIQDGITNREVVWDNATKVGAGIDARFLKNRLSLSLDGYYDHNYNMLTQLTSSVSLLVGQQLPSENYSSVDAFGTEVSLGWRDNINSDLNYGIRSFFTWSDNKNKITDVSQGVVGSVQDLTGKSSDAGVWGYQYAGMFRTQEQVDAYLVEHPGYKVFGQTPAPGMLYYEDISGPRVNGDATAPDGVITEDDVEYLTSKANNHYGVGLNFNVSYKSLSLFVNSGISWGGQALVEGDARKIAKSTVNRPVFWEDHWTPENTDAKYPNPYYSDSYDRTSAFWFRSSTSINISSINLSYTLPKKLTNKAGINNVRVYLIGTNPFDLYNPYKDFRSSSGTYLAYPELRTWSLGLNVGF